MPDKVLREPDPKKRIHAYYIIGEDPAQSDPDLPEIRRTLSAIDLVIVEDIFFNKTCEYADVIFPATAWGEHNAVYTSCDRRFQRVRKLIEPQPGCKTDWEILCLMATAMGYPMHYDNTEQIWDEMRSLCAKFAGASYEKMVENHGVQWPCTEDSPDDTGTQYLHKGAHFATADGKGHFYYYPWTPSKELESPEYPLSLSTVREVGHYSVRTMTGNCRLLADLADEPGYIQMNPEDCQELGIANGDLVRVVSKRSHTITRCQETDRVSKGATYMTYQWWVGACNELTSAALDPKSHTPEFKYCACRVEKIDDQKQAERDVKAQYTAIRSRMGIEVARCKRCLKHVKTDSELCIGCRATPGTAACVASHTGKALFALKPKSFDFTPRVHVVYTSKVTKAVQCQQCPKPRCMEACPFHCISLGPDSVVIDEETCRGCGKCSRACPFQAINMTKIYHGDTKGDPPHRRLQMRDLCANAGAEPACIPACPTEALSLFDPAVVAAQRAKLKAQKEAAKTQAAYEKALKKGKP